MSTIMSYNEELHKRQKGKKKKKNLKCLAISPVRKRYWSNDLLMVLEKIIRAEVKELTPVIAVPVQAQARGSRYHGALAIMKSPNV